MPCAGHEALVRELIGARPTLDELHQELGDRRIRIGRSSAEATI